MAAHTDKRNSSKGTHLIEALEALSGQLLFTLKKSVQVITPFKELAADPGGWAGDG